MVNLFTYSKTKHKRTYNPPLFNDYKKYKPTLQLEFEGQCVYCRALDKIKGYESFGVDHYRPKVQFAALRTEYLNLYYCCNRCNSFKSSYWPSSSQLKEGLYIPNPCEHVMFDHLRYHEGQVVHASVTGKWTIERLDLNDPQAIDFRKNFIEGIALIANQLKLSNKTINQLQAKLKTTSVTSVVKNIENKLEEAIKNSAKLEELITGLTGLALH